MNRAASRLAIIHCVLAATVGVYAWRVFGMPRTVLLLTILALPTSVLLCRVQLYSTRPIVVWAVYVALSFLALGSATAITLAWYSFGFGMTHVAQMNFDSFVRDIRSDAAFGRIVVERFPIETVWRSKGNIELRGTVATEEALLRLRQLGTKYGIAEWKEDIIVEDRKEPEKSRKRTGIILDDRPREP